MAMTPTGCISTIENAASTVAASHILVPHRFEVMVSGDGVLLGDASIIDDLPDGVMPDGTRASGRDNEAMSGAVCMCHKGQHQRHLHEYSDDGRKCCCGVQSKQRNGSSHRQFKEVAGTH